MNNVLLCDALHALGEVCVFHIHIHGTKIKASGVLLLSGSLLRAPTAESWHSGSNYRIG